MERLIRFGKFIYWDWVNGNVQIKATSASGRRVPAYKLNVNGTISTENGTINGGSNGKSLLGQLLR